MADSRRIAAGKTDSDEEKAAIAQHLNEKFASVASLARYLPLSVENLIQRCEDGVLLSYFITCIKSTAIPLSKLHRDIDLELLTNKRVKIPGSQHIFFATENANHVLKGASNIGIKLVNIGPEDIVAGNSTLLMGLLWQILRAELLKNISVAGHPELVRLLEDDESLLHLCQEGPESILMRWFNYHLKKAGSTRTVGNWNSDLEDSECFLILLSRIGKNVLDQQAITEALASDDLTKRAFSVIAFAERMGCNKFASAQDILKGKSQMNLAFTANLFNNYIGIRLPTEEEVEELQKMIERLKAVLREHGIRLDEEDMKSMQALETGARSLAKVIERCEALERQSADDEKAVREMEKMLLAANNLITELGNERTKSTEINQALLERQKRQDEKMKMLVTKLLAKNLSPETGEPISDTKKRSRSASSPPSTPSSATSSSTKSAAASDALKNAEQVLTNLLGTAEVENAHKAATSVASTDSDAFQAALVNELAKAAAETAAAQKLQMADMEKQNRQARQNSDVMLSKIEQIATALNKSHHERACANCGKRCGNCKNMKQ